ncbi:MAG: hypothetical protein CO129_00580 [Ignavibacteriales bacterium CG_4_9_14_3_um_filter_34_10]|nr:MAG: hypothetical protein CO129_00580 [Ignavibacteriales bacterium CG_4_9_14_3_um_filter_34_10]
MITISKLLMIFSAIILLSLMFVPIWNIDLNAPQYPEGIGLRIWISEITGKNEFDLHNINKLNHYIGMKTIEPDDIPELKIMPYIVWGLIILGLISALIKKRTFVLSWIIILLIILSIGLYDFYMWEYDYGHDLDKHAPIKVPGMVYQPPLIGTKQLLNMETTSSPAAGSYLIGLSMLLAVTSYYISGKEK